MLISKLLPLELLMSCMMRKYGSCRRNKKLKRRKGRNRKLS